MIEFVSYDFVNNWLQLIALLKAMLHVVHRSDRLVAAVRATISDKLICRAP